MKRLPKADLIYQRLKNYCSGLQEGEKFPSVRQLMRNFDISQLVVKTVIDRMCAEGMLTAVPRSGIRVLKPPTVFAHRILALTPGWFGFVPEVVNLLQFEIARRGDHFEVISYDINKDYLSLPPQAASADVILIFPSARPFSPCSWKILKEVGTPVIFVQATLPADELCSIGGANREGGRLAVDWLWERGHRKFAFLATEPDSITLTELRESFSGRCRELNASCRIIDCGVKLGDIPSVRSYDYLTGYLTGKRIDFTAAFVSIDIGALGVMKAFQDSGIRIPKDLSVIGYGGNSETALYSPPLTTITISRAEIARKTIELIDECLRDGSVCHQRRIVYPQLIERSSTSKLI